MRVLVADDDTASRKLLMATLSGWGYEPIAAATGAEALAVLSEDGPPTIALLDWEMPGVSGPEVCRILRARPSSDYTYLILVSGRGSRDDVVVGMDAGADDYLVKPVDPREMRVRIRAGRRIVDLQSQLIRARDDLHHRATHDVLTGVWNRAGVMDRLAAEVSRAHRDGRPLSIALLDLDHFKNINDSHGHATGDEVLKQTGARLRDVLRTYDVVGRWGGEEFLLVLPGAGARDCATVTERVRIAFDASPFETAGGRLGVTASIGAATLTVGSREQSDAFVGRADAALYDAKRSGRNRVCAAPYVEAAPRSSSGRLAAKVHERLREVLGDDARDEIAALIDEYVLSAVREVHGMRSAVLAGNFQQMRRHAHALKGASANFGVEQVATLAAEVEATTTEPGDMVDRLGLLVDRVTRELSRSPSIQPAG
jgi:two-component system, cell cycle response regulator